MPRGLLTSALWGAAAGPAMRSMIREISGDTHESRAVLLLPAAFNVGSILGPVLGGVLAQGGAVGEDGGGGRGGGGEEGRRERIGRFCCRMRPARETPTQFAKRAADPANNSSALIEVPAGYHRHLPFVFTGGLSFKPHDIAAVLAMRGVISLLLQLVFFPTLRDKFGTLRLYRHALLVFPATYFLTPYLALWAVLTAIVVVQSTARSLALPAGQMLLNAACPDRLALATVQGIGQSVTAASRGLGQLMMTGWLYGLGLNAGVVGAAWWGMAGVAVAAAMAAACVQE
ncbi:hypothetical protein PWT90_04796 [Aphanocladium album]|nr:hypothetical protein PWT90_04796 [Aphanocladium album]